MFIVIILGAYLDNSGFGADIVFLISFNICILPALAWVNALANISLSIPAIFISICIAVIPFSVPATLKSISPKWSSIPCISESTATLSSCFIRPIAIPATISFKGTPASSKDNVEPHTLPWDVEPLELNTSDTTLIAYGNSSFDGRTGISALSASAPCPISLLPGPLDGLASPTLYAGKL